MLDRITPIAVFKHGSVRRPVGRPIRAARKGNGEDVCQSPRDDNCCEHVCSIIHPVGLLDDEDAAVEEDDAQFDEAVRRCHE